MTLSINTNVASLTAQRAMINSNSGLETAFERLSTGKRINSASDDAAGLAIGKDLESRVSGLNQAVRNVNDGISMVQIAEGALDEVTTILQRMRDLAVQASNGSLSATERGYLDTEQSKLAETLGKVIDQSQFNGTDLVNDSASTGISIQSGADAGDSTTLSFAAMTETSLGVAASAIDLVSTRQAPVTVTFDTFLSESQVASRQEAAGYNLKLAAGGTGTYTTVIDGSTFTTSTIAAPGSVSDLATALNAATTGSATVSDMGTFSASGNTLVFTGFGGATADITLASSGFTTDQNSGGAATTFTNDGSGTTVVGVDALSGTHGYTLTVGSDSYVSTSATGLSNNKLIAAAIQTKLTADGVTAFSIGTAGNLDNGKIVLTYAAGNASLESTYSLTQSAFTTAAGTNDTDGVIDATTISSAVDAIATIDTALQTVATERASLGATQAQLESTVRNLANVAENTAAAAGRIMDTDYAAETANLTKAQILQQAATSILAQANAQPQSVLSLLQ